MSNNYSRKEIIEALGAMSSGNYKEFKMKQSVAKRLADYEVLCQAIQMLDEDETKINKLEDEAEELSWIKSPDRMGG